MNKRGYALPLALGLLTIFGGVAAARTSQSDPPILNGTLTFPPSAGSLEPLGPGAGIAGAVIPEVGAGSTRWFSEGPHAIRLHSLPFDVAIARSSFLGVRRGAVAAIPSFHGFNVIVRLR
jgi:hypothetical protein